MFYEEKLINGVLMFKSSPDGDWEPLSHAELSKRLLEKDAVIEKLTDYCANMSEEIELHEKHISVLNVELRCYREAAK